MRKRLIIKILFWGLVAAFLSASVIGQKESKPIIFAVINDGKTVEPVAHVVNGKLVNPVGGGEAFEMKKNFSDTFLKPKQKYNFVFGGTGAGTVNIVKSDPQAECSSNMAEVTVTTKKTKLKGFVMGLATSDAVNAKLGERRLPTRRERIQLESLVRKEFRKNGVGSRVSRNLKYLNLTAINIDRGKAAEFIGSYYVRTSKTNRALLFFIAEKTRRGYRLIAKKFSKINQKDLMNSEIETVDRGVYHELLIDVFDYNNDGIKEVFTMTQGFEGTTFNAYSRSGGIWKISYEFSNYHCGF